MDFCVKLKRGAESPSNTGATAPTPPSRVQIFPREKESEDPRIRANQLWAFVYLAFHTKKSLRGKEEPLKSGTSCWLVLMLFLEAEMPQEGHITNTQGYA